MLPALSLRLRASCLKWHRIEPQRLSHSCRQASNTSKWQSNKKIKSKAVGRKDEVKSKPEPASEPAPALPLLEELFPEETQRRDISEREVPRLALDKSTASVNLNASLAEERQFLHRGAELPLDELVSSSAQRNAKKFYTRLERQGEKISVLVLRNASKNLIKDDFTRVIPQGQHVEGWVLERGDILKVIPGRDTASLDRQNFYFILFKSPASAFSYQTHVTRLHQLAQSQTPSSLHSPIPPPPGYVVGGQDIEALLQSYSLIPSSQKIDIRQLSSPFSPSVQEIVRHQGYPGIVNRPGKAPIDVLLGLEGPQLTPPQIRAALWEVSRRRRMPWTGDDDRLLELFRWDPAGYNISPLSNRELGGSEEGEADPRNETSPFGDWDESLQAGPNPSQRQRRRPAPRYIIGFKTEVEAQTFVRYWHRRVIEPDARSNELGDLGPVVNAEILW